MEDNLNFFEYGSLPEFFRKWKTTSNVLKIEDNLKKITKNESKTMVVAPLRVT